MSCTLEMLLQKEKECESKRSLDGVQVQNNKQVQQ
jgi:hypothetical protein